MIPRVIRALKLSMLLGGGAFCFAVAVITKSVAICAAAVIAALLFGFLFFYEVEKP